MLPEALRENPVAIALEQSDPEMISGGHTHRNEVTIEIVPSKILTALRLLKEQKFERLATVTAVDRYPMEPRFEVIYQMQSVARNLIVRLKCRVSGQNPEIDSATAVYASANWYERETWDLFGIRFTGHPNLTRIMMPDFWEGHPLRRDFPVHGHKYTYSHE
jgi:NADH-quinone oxidoreductase subunit C